MSTCKDPFQESAWTPAVLFPHWEAEIKYLTARGPRPSWAFKRKPFEVRSSQQVCNFLQLVHSDHLVSPPGSSSWELELTFPAKSPGFPRSAWRSHRPQLRLAVPGLSPSAARLPTGPRATEQARKGKSWFLHPWTLGASVLRGLTNQEPNNLVSQNVHFIFGEHTGGL